MSLENASKFLRDVANHNTIRQNFVSVSNSEEFMEIARNLGYSFTLDEFKNILQEHSKGVKVRRNTGVWKWLREIHWL